MRTLAYIIAGIIIFCSLGLVGIILYVLSQKNKTKTAAARSARWPEKNLEVVPSDNGTHEPETPNPEKNEITT